MTEWMGADVRFDVLLIADHCGEVDDAVAALGGRVQNRVKWDRLSIDLACQARDALLLIEAQGVAESVLAEQLPHLARSVADGELSAIVALDQDQIDQVAGGLLGLGVQMLCAPTVAERVAAIAVAVETRGHIALNDRLAEGEAARLAKLNEEVARIAEVLARLSRHDDTAFLRGDVADRRAGFEAGAAEQVAIDPQEIRQVIRARRLRDKQFGTGLFEDPAWDMLLDLFAAHLERAQVSVSSLCIAAAVAPTTALRWIAKMTDAGLFERQPDPFDRRRAFMALSPGALDGMRAYVAATRAQGLPIA